MFTLTSSPAKVATLFDAKPVVATLEPTIRVERRRLGWGKSINWNRNRPFAVFVNDVLLVNVSGKTRTFATKPDAIKAVEKFVASL